MNNGKILKNGNTCYVSLVSFNSRNIVLKRYNHKGFIHSLRHTIKGSRAHKNWLKASKLKELSISVPKTLGFVDRYKVGILWNSYFIYEYVDGIELDKILKKQNSDFNIEKIAKDIDESIKKMVNNNISHSDMKSTNFLIADDKTYILDIDAVRLHKNKWYCRIEQKKNNLRMDKIVRCKFKENYYEK